MSISPKCDIRNCGKELGDFGAILLSPPGGEKKSGRKKVSYL